MVTRIQTIIFDDITGEEGATTHRLTLDAVNYEIDLVDDKALVEALAPFVAAGRKVPGGHRSPVSATAPKSDHAHNLAVRAWAIETGLTKVSSRGRIARDVYAAYSAAH